MVSSGPGRQVLGAAHGQLSAALVSGEVSQLARHLSPAARAALTHSYRVGFTGAFTVMRGSTFSCSCSDICLVTTSTAKATHHLSQHQAGHEASQDAGVLILFRV